MRRGGEGGRGGRGLEKVKNVIVRDILALDSGVDITG